MSALTQHSPRSEAAISRAADLATPIEGRLPDIAAFGRDQLALEGLGAQADSPSDPLGSLTVGATAHTLAGRTGAPPHGNRKSG